jgi:hypothetical protein
MMLASGMGAKLPFDVRIRACDFLGYSASPLPYYSQIPNIRAIAGISLFDRKRDLL